MISSWMSSMRRKKRIDPVGTFFRLYIIITTTCFPAWFVMCPFGPTFLYWDVSFCACLQTSRLRIDDKWTLGAVMVQSGNPPAVFRAGHIGCIRPKRVKGVGSFGSPRFLYWLNIPCFFPFFTAVLCLLIKNNNYQLLPLPFFPVLIVNFLYFCDLCEKGT